MKPRLIKAHEIAPQQRFITFHIPMIDTGHNAEQKIEKMKEELDELLDEFCNGTVDVPAALSEMFDVIQVMVGYLLARNKELQPLGDAVDSTVVQMNDGAELHGIKMENYSRERGWMKVMR